MAKNKKNIVILSETIAFDVTSQQRKQNIISFYNILLRNFPEYDSCDYDEENNEIIIFIKS